MGWDGGVRVLFLDHTAFLFIHSSLTRASHTLRRPRPRRRVEQVPLFRVQGLFDVVDERGRGGGLVKERVMRVRGKKGSGEMVFV